MFIILKGLFYFVNHSSSRMLISVQTALKKSLHIVYKARIKYRCVSQACLEKYLCRLVVKGIVFKIHYEKNIFVGFDIKG